MSAIIHIGLMSSGEQICLFLVDLGMKRRLGGKNEPMFTSQAHSCLAMSALTTDGAMAGGQLVLWGGCV